MRTSTFETATVSGKMTLKHSDRNPPSKLFSSMQNFKEEKEGAMPQKVHMNYVFRGIHHKNWSQWCTLIASITLLKVLGPG